MTNRTLTVVSSIALAAVLMPVAHAAEGNLVAGTFAWPVKKSFIEHVLGPIAAGNVTGSGGATFEGRQLVFPVDTQHTSIDAQGNGTVALAGQAEIVAYRGLGENGQPGLDLTYSDLKLRLTGTHAELVGDYHVTGKRGANGQALDRSGDDVVLVTFELPQRVNSGADLTALRRPTTVGQGVADSLLRYKVGETWADGDVDFILDYADGKDAGTITNRKLEGGAELSAQVATLSSDHPSGIGIGVTVAAILGVVSLLGGVVAAALGLLPGVAPLLPWRHN